MSASASSIVCLSVSILSAEVLPASSVEASAPSAPASAEANSSVDILPFCSAVTIVEAILVPNALMAMSFASVAEVAFVMEDSRLSQSALASVPALALSAKDCFMPIITALESMPCFSKDIIKAIDSSREYPMACSVPAFAVRFADS